MSKISELLKNQIGSPACICGAEEFKLKQKTHANGVHVGLYCKACGTWIKWVVQEQVKAEVESETLQERLL